MQWLFIFLLLACAGCGSGGAKGSFAGLESGAGAAPKHGELSGKIVITGSSTIAPLCSELGKKFEAIHPRVRVDVQSGGSSRGISDARAGIADIGMCSRALKDEEKDLHGFVVARDGVCVILHRNNPVSELSDKQVVEIYSGRVTNWKDVGGRDAPITVVNKAEGRSTLELFCQYYKLKNPEIRAHVVIGDNEQGLKTVAGNPDSIGYVSVGTAEFDAGQGNAIKLLPVGGVAASLENVKNQAFPLSRPLTLVTKNEPAGIVKAFLDFALSKNASDIIKEQFFVPLEE